MAIDVYVVIYSVPRNLWIFKSGVSGFQAISNAVIVHVNFIISKGILVLRGKVFCSSRKTNALGAF